MRDINSIKIKVKELPILNKTIINYTSKVKINNCEAVYYRNIVSSLEGYYQKNYDIGDNKKIKIKFELKEWIFINSILSNIDKTHILYKVKKKINKLILKGDLL